MNERYLKTSKFKLVNTVEIRMVNMDRRVISDCILDTILGFQELQ